MTLDPATAAKLADAVYGIRADDNIARGIAARGVKGLENDFDIGAAIIAQGTSGAGVISQRSGFALVVPGRGAKAHELAVISRGTATTYDWLSNLQVAITRGPGGYMVHAGIQRVYESIADRIVEHLRGRNPSTIHCVGHSLGGAVANLVAARLAGVAEIKLYTFGAPRAGLSPFADNLTEVVQAGNIHRAYNPSDPVPMVPIFPFRHAATTADGVRVGSGHGLIAINAHYMSAYRPAVGGHSWRALQAASPDLDSRLSVDYWLDRAAENVSFPGSTFAFYALDRALRLILKATEVVLGTTVVAAATLLDRLATLLHRAAMLSLELGERIMSLLSYVLRFTGRTMATGAQLTVAFIAWVLGLLIRPLAAAAQICLSRAVP